VASSSRHLSLEIGNSVMFTLDKSGGNDVLLINSLRIMATRFLLDYYSADVLTVA